MSNESSIDVAELIRQWRADLISDRVLTAAEFNERRVDQLADAVIAGDARVALGRLGIKVMDRFEDAHTFVQEQARGRQLRHRDQDVVLKALVAPRHNRPEPTQREPQAVEEAAPENDSPWDGTWASYRGDPPKVRNNLNVEVHGGKAAVRWRKPTKSDEICLYRVTHNDQFMPFSPEAGVHSATREVRSEIELPVHSALRCVQVWAHIGATEEAARDSAPIPVADTILVAQPQQLQIREDQGDIYCRWALPNFSGDYAPLVRAHVQRFPHRNNGSGQGGSGQDIPAELSGFQDSTAEPGRDYDYRIEIVAELPDGRRVNSAAVEASVSVSAVHQAVTDLSCTPAGDDSASPTFQAQWSPPSVGTVRIYRTRDELPGGYAFEEREASVLSELFDDDSELPNPVSTDRETGQQRMTRIRRPREWSLMYLTPVTVLREKVIIGATVASEASLAAPASYRLIQRVFEQELRFAWPKGADEVRVYVGARGQEATVGSAQSADPIKRITADEFRRTGVVRLSLPPTGVAVILRAGKNLAGRYVEGHPVIMDYPGLLTLQYSAAIKAGMFRKPSVEMSVWVDQSRGAVTRFSRRPYFVAIHNEDRLPLHASDGTFMLMEPKDGGGTPATRFQPSSILNAPGLEVWVGKVPVKAGYVRLFAAERPEALSMMALLDPPVDRLKVG